MGISLCYKLFTYLNLKTLFLFLSLILGYYLMILIFLYKTKINKCLGILTLFHLLYIFIYSYILLCIRVLVTYLSPKFNTYCRVSYSHIPFTHSKTTMIVGFIDLRHLIMLKTFLTNCKYVELTFAFTIQYIKKMETFR